MSAARLILIVVAGMLLGWVAGHNAIATDCDRIGTFFDGKHVRGCTPRRAATPGISNH